MSAEPTKSPLWKKLAWFAALWAGGVVAAMLAGWLIKMAIPG